MTEAVIKIVVYHTDGHAIWIAPWLVATSLSLLAVYLIVAVVIWMVRP